jgi:uncharacterized protein (UPF0332 family)
MAKANALLGNAETMLQVELADATGRTAYLAAFHAAQALIFERHERVFKTHSGVQAEFVRLVKDDPRVDSELRAFLGFAYKLKAIADYESGPGAKVTAETASAALKTARRFVQRLAELVAGDDPPRPA